MLVDLPLLLPQHPSLLSLPFQPAAQHPLWRSLHLAVWPLSGIVTKQQAFQRKLLTSYWRRGQQPPRSVMQAPGRHGFAGVLNGSLSHFSSCSRCPCISCIPRYSKGLTELLLYKSVISQAHDPIGSTRLGSLPVVSRF